MSPTTIRILIGVFLIAHGLVHASLTNVPVAAPGAMRTPFWPAWWRADVDPQWLASQFGLDPAVVRTLGSILWVATLAGFALAGLALIFFPAQAALWSAAAVFGAVASLLLLVFFWHPWLVAGVVINLAVFGALALQWPAAVFGK